MRQLLYWLSFIFGKKLVASSDTITLIILFIVVISVPLAIIILILNEWLRRRRKIKIDRLE